ncbi:MAG: hypothetical protein ACREP7_11675 [Lysobacter sp.]
MIPRLIPLSVLPLCLLAACTQKSAAPAQPAKSSASAAKPALALRAIGTEPGWLVEVGSGGQPSVSLQLDYGQRKLNIAQATVIEEENAYAGTANDGSAVVLSYKREQCSDGMSDRDYPASVALQVGDQHYKGCAEFPSP